MKMNKNYYYLRCRKLLQLVFIAGFSFSAYADGANDYATYRLSSDPHVTNVISDASLSSVENHGIDHAWKIVHDVVKRNRFNELANIKSLRQSLKNDRIIVYDEGMPLVKHRAFSTQRNKITFGEDITHDGTYSVDDKVSVSSHTTEIASLLMSNHKKNQLLKGAVLGAKIDFETYNNALEKMSKTAHELGENDSVISNHSYGRPRGWYDVCRAKDGNYYHVYSKKEEIPLGLYDAESKQFDQFAFNHPNWVQVVASGNFNSLRLNHQARATDYQNNNVQPWEGETENNEVKLPLSVYHGHGGCDNIHVHENLQAHEPGTHPVNGIRANEQSNLLRYKTVSGGQASGHNVVTVGNAILPNLLKGLSPDDDEVIHSSYESANGPSANGIMKPDVVASLENTRTATTEKSCFGKKTCNVGSSGNIDSIRMVAGSSYATAVVTGGLYVMNILKKTLASDSLNTIEAKMILALTSRNKSDRPTYRAGWGLVNFAEGSCVITNAFCPDCDCNSNLCECGKDRYSLGKFQIDHLVPANNHVLKIADSSSRGDRVTVVIGTMIDPEYEQYIDAEIIVSSKDGTLSNHSIYPWMLSPENPSEKASRSKNTLKYPQSVLKITIDRIPPSSEILLKIARLDNSRNTDLQYSLLLDGLSYDND